MSCCGGLLLCDSLPQQFMSDPRFFLGSTGACTPLLLESRLECYSYFMNIRALFGPSNSCVVFFLSGGMGKISMREVLECAVVL